MKEYQSLRHTRWDCKYHVVFIPKRRKKRIFGVLRRHLGEIFREVASHKESQIVERHMMGDHVPDRVPGASERRGHRRIYACPPGGHRHAPGPYLRGRTSAANQMQGQAVAEVELEFDPRP
jgi:hypothetical protein